MTLAIYEKNLTFSNKKIKMNCTIVEHCIAKDDDDDHDDGELF